MGTFVILLLIKMAQLAGMEDDFISHFGKEFFVTTPTGAKSSYIFFQTKESKKVIVQVKVFLKSPYNDFVTIPPAGVGKFAIKGSAVSSAVVTEPIAYKLDSDHPFTIYVAVLYGEFSYGTFQVWPTSMLGQAYFVYTMANQPFIHIVAINQGTMISMEMASMHRPTKLPKNWQTANISKSLISLQGVLNTGDVYSMAFCSSQSKGSLDLKGVRILSDPHAIVVIAGNCAPTSVARSCDKHSVSQPITYQGDIAVEMLTGMTDLSTEYIVMGIPSRKSQGYISVNAVVAETDFCLSKNDLGDRDCYSLTLATDSVELDVSLGARRLNSSRAVQVFYLQTIACYSAEKTEIGGVSMCTLVPTSSFHNEYYWQVEIDKGSIIQHYAAVISQDATLKDIRLNGDDITKNDWNWVNGTRKWKYAEIKVTHVVNKLTARDSEVFGCYVYGLGQGFSYMHAAGRRTLIGTSFIPPGNAGENVLAMSECTVKTSMSGDRVDNDCDGEIDEEAMNSIDDDGDGLIDEDLETTDTRDGWWGDWSTWICTDSCETYQVRSRDCNKPKPAPGRRHCLGQPLERKASDCKLCGGWNEWKEWGCTQICNATYVQRNRTCVNPKPIHPKLNCVGESTQQKPSTCNPCQANNGEWGDWTQWHCLTDVCNYMYSQYRNRTCDRNTVFDENMRCFGSFHEERIVCPPYRWGAECVKDCYNCVDECDVDGICSSCILGHKFPNMSCSHKCEELQYGANCEGDCLEKCGVDCIERLDGTCPFNKLYLLSLLILVIPVFVLVYYLDNRESSPTYHIVETTKTVLAPATNNVTEGSIVSAPSTTTSYVPTVTETYKT